MVAKGPAIAEFVGWCCQITIEDNEQVNSENDIQHFQLRSASGHVMATAVAPHNVETARDSYGVLFLSTGPLEQIAELDKECQRISLLSYLSRLDVEAINPRGGAGIIVHTAHPHSLSICPIELCSACVACNMSFVLILGALSDTGNASRWRPRNACSIGSPQSLAESQAQGGLTQFLVAFGN